MRGLRVRGVSCALGAFWLIACGGSSSETPFPQEPLPDYLLKRAKTKMERKAAAEPAASAGKAEPESADSETKESEESKPGAKEKEPPEIIITPTWGGG